MTTNILEPFTIPITEWKTVDAGKNTIRIKGVALKGDVISKNQRLYIAKELMKSTNTFIGKPINLHHNSPENKATNIGHITWMDWDEKAELLTYEAEITKQPYVNMIRNKSTEIRGVSIQANFLHNRCPDCNTKFYTEEDFRGHMWQNHFKKVSAVPHGIIGEAITLVLSPEVPGFSGTTVNLAEIQRQETLRLFETVIQVEKEREEYMSKLNCGVMPRPSVSVGSVAEVKNPPEKAEPKAASAEVKEKRETLQKQAFEQSGPKDDKNFYGWDKATQDDATQIIKTPSLTEVTVKPAETITLKEAKIAGLNEIASTKLRLGEPFAQYENFEACVAANQDKENPESYCGKIKHETEEIVNLKANVKQITAKLNELVQEVNKPVTFTLPEVKVPQDDLSWKDSIVQIQEQFKAEIEKVSETVKALPQDDLGWKEVKPYDDAPLREIIEANKYNDASIKELIESSKYNDASIKELIEASRFNPATLEQKLGEVENKIVEASKTVDAKISELKTSIPAAYNDQPLKEQVAAIKPYDDTPIKEMLSKLHDIQPLKEMTEDELLTKIVSLDAEMNNLYPKPQLAQKESPEDEKTRNERWIKQEVLRRTKEQLTVALVNKKVAKALEAMETLDKKVAEQKKDFDTLLESSDKAVKEYFSDIKKQRESDQQKIKELEGKLKEHEEKKVSETQNLQIRVDNLEDKLKPEFKGHSKRETASSAPLINDPTTGRPRQ